MKNPYAEALLSLPPTYRRNGESLRQFAENQREPAFHRARELLIAQYGWSCPTEGAIRGIAEFAPAGLVDFGAGCGYWALLIATQGCDVIALDNWVTTSPGLKHYPVQTGSYERLPALRTRALMLCWPPRASPMALNALNSWGGDRLVYVGEPEPARSTADPAFLETLRLYWDCVRTLPVIQWFNRSDAVFLYVKRTVSEVTL